MAIRWEKLTVKSQQAMQQAQEHAAELGNPEIQPVHLLLALVEDREGVIPAVLGKIGVPTERLLLGAARQKGDPANAALVAAGATHEAILQALQAVRGSQRVTDQNPEG